MTRQIKIKFLSLGDEFIFQGKNYFLLKDGLAIRLEEKSVLETNPDMVVIPSRIGGKSL